MTILHPKRIPVAAVVLILLGVLAAVTPWYIFPVCEMKGTSDNGMADMNVNAGNAITNNPGTHMKCWYTAEAETGVGILLLLAGLAMLLLPWRVSRKTAGILGVVFGILIILIPTVIIGVCDSPDAACRIGTLPALILLGAITIIFSIYLVLSKDTTSTDLP
jgi:Domain of unknown function (DUF4418)